MGHPEPIKIKIIKKCTKIIIIYGKIDLLTLRAAKSGLTILEILNLQKKSLKRYLKEKCWSEAK